MKSKHVIKCFSAAYSISITLTSKDGKETEHDRIEEAKAHGKGVLVDDSRDDEHREHGSCSEFPFRQLQGSEKEQRGFGSEFRGQYSGESVSLDLQDYHYTRFGNTCRIQGYYIIDL